MSSKLIVDTKVGISCPDIGIIIDCTVQKALERSATVVHAQGGTLPVFDPGTILRIASQGEVLWGVVAASGKTRLDITDIDYWDRKNRREFFRLSLLDTIDLIHYDEEGQAEPVIKGKLLDISATGMRFSSPRVWGAGDQIQILWKNNTIEGGQEFTFCAQIVRAETHRTGGFYGCKFVNLSAKEQDALMREIFKIQMTQRKRV